MFLKLTHRCHFLASAILTLKRVRAKAMASTMMKSGSTEIDLASPLLTIKKVEVVELFSFCFIPCVPY